jgi:hypothetical protein
MLRDTQTQALKWALNIMQHKVSEIEPGEFKIQRSVSDLQVHFSEARFFALHFECVAINITIPHRLLQNMFFTFDGFLTVHHNIDLFHLPTLMHNSFIH